MLRLLFVSDGCGSTISKVTAVLRCLWKKLLLSGKSEALTEIVQIASRSPIPCEASPPRQWYAIYTRSSHEKQVAEHFSAREIENFLPRYQVVRRWKNRCTKTLDLPLFPGYLFARVASNERSAVLGVPSVVSIIGAGGNPLPLRDELIDVLRAGLHLRNSKPYPYLVVGRKARICQGPLAGMVGIVSRKGHKLRVVLTIDLIMKGVVVEVDGADLQPLSAESADSVY